MKWYENINMNDHPLFKHATFIRIGKDTNATRLVEKYDFENENTKTIKINSYESYRDYYYYVGAEATSKVTNSIRKIMISRKGFLIKDKTNDTLILPIYCDNTPTYDDESVGKIIGLDHTIILNEDFEEIDKIKYGDIFGYDQNGYLVYPLPENYNDLEYIEGDIQGESSIDVSWKTYNRIHFTIKLYDLELVVFENYEAFVQERYIQNNCIVSDCYSLNYDKDYHEIKIENIKIDYLNFSRECFIPKNQFVNCEIEVITIENENVDFDEEAFVNCVCESIDCYPKQEAYFKEIFPDASIEVYKI